MVRKHTKKVAGRRRRSHTQKRGGGYGFGGSVLSNVGGPNAGNAVWDSDTGKDCGVANRGGNNTLAGGRRRGRGKGKGKKTAGRRRRHVGGTMALQQPRTGYTFNGSGVAGTADTVPVGSPVTVV
uniref:Uncharacterized protein n=1 Tax=viral metagenome TaxID=1070528 RepID=A0A6C0AJ40_9ZZZZ